MNKGQIQREMKAQFARVEGQLDTVFEILVGIARGLHKRGNSTIAYKANSERMAMSQFLRELRREIDQFASETE